MSTDYKLKSYSEVLARVNQITNNLDRSDDIDNILEMYEEAMSHLNECEKRLAYAKGRFEEISDNK